MGKRSDGTSTEVLISIYQEYAEAILNGEKVIEFRKSRFPKVVSRVYLYSTSPVQKVIGHFDVKGVLRASPRSLWNQYGKRGSIGYEDYVNYYGNAEEACGILVKRVVRYSRPVDLKEIDPAMSVPQSYRYLTEELIEKLESKTLGIQAGYFSRVVTSAFGLGRIFAQ
jgi:predicted transcriptional regulator